MKPLSIIYNKKSGFHITQNADDIYAQVMSYLSEHGFDVYAYDLGEVQDFDKLMDEVLERHQNDENTGVVVAAGGDGTLNAVASKLIHTDIPMGILPLGTFNYVARVLNIPLELMQAVEVIATGQTRDVHVAKINDKIYLNNASLGLYPLFIEKREFYNKKFGRFPLNAYTSGLDVLIRNRKELKLEVEIDGKKYPVKTPLVFFGNNQLQLADMHLHIAECAEKGQVAGVVVATSSKLNWFKILVKLIRGAIDHASNVYSFAADQVKIHSKSKKITLAIDGELFQVQPPLNISVAKNALKMMVPK